MCLDYYSLKEGERDIQVELTEAKIDFLIACGLPFNYSKRHPLSLQFSTRNDGMGDGEVEVVRLQAGWIVESVPSVKIEDDLHLTLIEVV